MASAVACAVLAVTVGYVVTQAEASGPACTTKTLQYGSKDECVKTIQDLLDVPSTPPYTATFGPKTKAQVIVAQKFVGVTPDGIVGPNTWTAMCKKLKYGVDSKGYGGRPRIGCTGKTTKNGKSYYTGRTK